MSTRRTVTSFDALHTQPFEHGVNALCWPRTLEGDFDEVARALAPRDGYVDVGASQLRALRVSPAGQRAIALLLADLARLDALGLEPVLSCITRYPRDERGLPVATDLLSFHVDRAPIETDTWLCTYAGDSTEGLEPADAARWVDDEVTRSALRRAYGGDDDEGFAAYLRDGAFDLHYRALDGALPFSFGVGHLWRVAVEWPGARVPACIHRAPAWHADASPRLLLIS